MNLEKLSHSFVPTVSWVQVDSRVIQHADPSSAHPLPRTDPLPSSPLAALDLFSSPTVVLGCSVTTTGAPGGQPPPSTCSTTAQERSGVGVAWGELFSHVSIKDFGTRPWRSSRNQQLICYPCRVENEGKKRTQRPPCIRKYICSNSWSFFNNILNVDYGTVNLKEETSVIQ